MNARKLFISLFAATSMAAAPLAMAEMGRTESTIVGAAVGGVAGSLIGGDMQSTLLGAAAGGLLGNLISKNNSNYTREGYYNNRYYYGGRELEAAAITMPTAKPCAAICCAIKKRAAIKPTTATATNM